ncbi:MAG: excinuclease ABC subunit UvrC [Lachnospiraceae bacterium]|nr:excinuclease ABC subunit UvrC [Lachnospiraceae bacterium]
MFDIKEELKKLPDRPGVYLMHGEHDEIIYVGKAVILKNRVRQYFQSSRNLSPKIRQMVKHVARFEYIVTDTEMEALVLENNLIKEHRPKYNTMLRDDKTYPYIKVTAGEEFPRILFVRKVSRDKARYFGPYTSSTSVHDTIDLARELFKIRPCSRRITDEPTKPCLYYHMGQCEAPCAGYVSAEKYSENVKEALRFLDGKTDHIEAMLTEKMNAAAADLDFENAARYRDLLSSVRFISQKQKISGQEPEDKDVIAFARQNDEAVMQVFFIRDGKMTGREHFYLTGVSSEEDSEVIGAFIKQYYASAPFVPGTLMVQKTPEDAELIQEWLSGVKGRKVTIAVPARGQKEKLVELAAENARIVLERDKEKIKLEEARTAGAVRELAEMLGIASGIKRMEAYDISNTSGVESVGSMIVFEDGKPKRNAYRKFRIRTVKGPDDYHSLQEVLTRRLSHDRDDENFGVFPDVIMMDGGKGQVNIALEVMEDLGLEIPVCGMVKDDNHRTRGLIYENQELPIDTRDELFKLITRMQDEAHRFAIEYHRKLRGKAQIDSVLDEIPGIGPARRKALVRYFRDISAIRSASPEELAAADGMNRSAARAVYDYFH